MIAAAIVTVAAKIADVGTTSDEMIETIDFQDRVSGTPFGLFIEEHCNSPFSATQPRKHVVSQFGKSEGVSSNSWHPIREGIGFR